MINNSKHLFLKSPSIPLYQRGSVYGIFMFLCEPKAHVDSCGSRNPDAVPAKAGNYTKELDSRFHGKPGIPHQVRNDKGVRYLSRNLILYGTGTNITISGFYP